MGSVSPVDGLIILKISFLNAIATPHFLPIHSTMCTTYFTRFLLGFCKVLPAHKTRQMEALPYVLTKLLPFSISKEARQNILCAFSVPLYCLLCTYLIVPCNDPYFCLGFKRTIHKKITTITDFLWLSNSVLQVN